MTNPARPTIFYLLHYLENRGGTENHVRDLMRGLKDHFKIFALYREGLDLVVRDEDHQITRFQTEEIPWLFVPYSAPRTEAVLQNIITKYKPDIVHIHHLINWPLSTIELLKRSAIKTILTLHDYFLITPDFTLQSASSPEECLSDQYAKKLGLNNADYLKKRHLAISKFLPLLDQIICPSNACRDIFSKVFNLNYSVIEHGIEPFDSLQRKAHEKTRIGYVGSLLPQKGWNLLLEAFLRLEHNKDYELHFYGGHQASPASNVTFHGVYERADLPRICSQIDLAVIPSIFAETYCYTLSELWMGGVPVITSDIGALSQRIRDGINGRKFKARDIQSLSSTISEVLTEKQHTKWNITRPRTIEQMIASYQQIYS